MSVVDSAVLLRRVSRVRRNLDRLREKKGVEAGVLENDQDVQDVVLHNLQHAIQGCIDIGAHVLADEGWGSPGSQVEIFRMLGEKGVIAAGLTDRMTGMVGLRNVLVHEYDHVNMDLVRDFLKQDLRSIDEFLLAVVHHFQLDKS
jgi:uncharacterized protein YutE (UPF0331/DUF86 family)